MRRLYVATQVVPVPGVRASTSAVTARCLRSTQVPCVGNGSWPRNNYSHEISRFDRSVSAAATAIAGCVLGSFSDNGVLENAGLRIPDVPPRITGYSSFRCKTSPSGYANTGAYVESREYFE